MYKTFTSTKILGKSHREINSPTWSRTLSRPISWENRVTAKFFAQPVLIRDNFLKYTHNMASWLYFHLRETRRIARTSRQMKCEYDPNKQRKNQHHTRTRFVTTGTRYTRLVIYNIKCVVYVYGVMRQCRMPWHALLLGLFVGASHIILLENSNVCGRPWNRLCKHEKLFCLLKTDK